MYIKCKKKKSTTKTRNVHYQMYYTSEPLESLSVYLDKNR